jgi:hypothetical protein
MSNAMDSLQSARMCGDPAARDRPGVDALHTRVPAIVFDRPSPGGHGVRTRLWSPLALTITAGRSGRIALNTASTMSVTKRSLSGACR